VAEVSKIRSTYYTDLKSPFRYFQRVDSAKHLKFCCFFCYYFFKACNFLLSLWNVTFINL